MFDVEYVLHVPAEKHYSLCVFVYAMGECNKKKKKLGHECKVFSVQTYPLSCELFDLGRWVSFCEACPASSRHLFVHTMS